ncbi:hypothetical protein C8F04DRAFT_1177616 [Mycena alexandri]|uniref:Uncharacterized protein n=1 Tax=Mycena alexandri TaxID=1745969 RepID=A0AAD6T7S8_9AGAR|nr:hypothetical protein C8F04DRAFT_1177616 [Mycena alexandri]
MGVNMSARRIKQAFNVPTSFDASFNSFNIDPNHDTRPLLRPPLEFIQPRYFIQLTDLASGISGICSMSGFSSHFESRSEPKFSQESKEFIHTMKPGIPKNCLTLQSLYTSLSNYCTYSDEASMAPQRLEGDASRAAAIGSNHNKAAGDRGPNAVMPRGPCTT